MGAIFFTFVAFQCQPADMRLRIIAPKELNASITLPPSKSVQSRLLMLAALSNGAGMPSLLAPSDNDCDDIRLLKQALLTADEVVDVCDSGTALRFLTAFFSLRPGRHIVTGSARLCQRPLSPLVDALRMLGAKIEYMGTPGYAPVRIHGGMLHGGRVEIDASESSQFISALMLISPFVDGCIEIVRTGRHVSSPYIEMTAAILNSFPLSGSETNPLNSLNSLNPSTEGDWTAASYWYEMMLLSGGRVEFANLNRASCQGDSVVPQWFRRISESDVVDIDFTDNPDLFPSVAVTCWALGKRLRSAGTENLRLKESDREVVVMDELKKIEQGADTISSHNDHRIAMAFAPLAFRLPHIIIDGAEAVSKSYPAYWRHLQEAGFQVQRLDIE